MSRIPSRLHVVLPLLLTVLLSTAVTAGTPPIRPDADALAAWRDTLNATPGRKVPDHLLGGEIEVFLELAQAPTALVYRRTLDEAGPAKAATAKAAVTRAHLAAVDRAQAALLDALAAAPVKTEVLARVRHAANGIAVRLDAADVPALRALPGVTAVRPLPRLRASTARSVPFVGAAEIWQNLGVHGEGIRLAVLDSGVDYLHPHFGGSGNPADYAGRELNPAAFFPTARVAGGWDFVDDDLDPFDCAGHGTHVAGIAAGNGVGTDGAAYTGPYGDALSPAAFLIGPGVAPAATLYALRVLDCDGVGENADVLQGLDWVLDPDGDGDLSDRLDVVNLSLGAPFGSTEDVLATAVDNVSAAGVIVVAAAGNLGDTHFVVDTPGSAASAISVAASVDDGQPGARLRIHAPASLAGDVVGRTPVNFGGGLTNVELRTGIVAAESPGSVLNPRDACFALDNAGEAAGQIVLADRGGCSFITKAWNVQQAGGAAVLIVNHVDNLTAFGAGEGDALIPLVDIPAVMIGFSDGQRLYDQAGALDATLSDGPLSVVADTLVPITSRGPARGGVLKPDVAAPGFFVTSSVPPASNFDTESSGTSMAAPHVAGLAVLLRQVHPQRPVHEIKAALMNTAAGVFAGQRQTPPAYSPARVGAGRADGARAVDATSLAYSDTHPERVSLYFETVEVFDTAYEEQLLRVVNHGNTDVRWTASYEAAVDAPGVDVLVPIPFTVRAGSSAVVPVAIEARAAEMLHDVDPTGTPIQFQAPRFWMSEESGILRLDGSDGSTLRLPVYLAPRPAGRVRDTRGAFARPTEFLPLRGAGVDTTLIDSEPIGIQSLVTPSELQYASPDAPGTPDALDLAYVGLASDFRSVEANGGDLGEATLFFTVATHGNWSTLHEVSFQVEIDTDRDGNRDFLVFTTDTGSMIQRDPNDVFVSAVLSRDDAIPFAANPINNLPANAADVPIFNTNVVMFSVPLELLGFEHADGEGDGHEDDGEGDGHEHDGEDDGGEGDGHEHDGEDDGGEDPCADDEPTDGEGDGHDHGAGTVGSRHGDEEHEDDEPTPGADECHDDDGHHAFDYIVRVGSPELGLQTDITPVLTYDPSNPGVDFSDLRNTSDLCPCPGVLTWASRDGEGIPVAVFPDAMAANGTDGLLLLHHHNDTPESRAQVLVHGRNLRPGRSWEVSDFETGHWKWFTWDAPARSGPVTFTLEGGAGNPDLYLRHGIFPSLDAFDAASTNPGTGESVTIEDPQPGTYVIGIVAVQAYGNGVTVSARQGR